MTSPPPQKQQKMTETSTIPTSCTQTESTVVEAPLEKVWGLFRTLSFGKLSAQVTSSEFESGGEGTVGSIVKLTYADGSIWRIRVTEFSERNYTVAYELLTAEPTHKATSVQGEIKCVKVTTCNHTFVIWTTDYSNDADVSVIEDQKYKKQEFFKQMKSHV